MADPVALPSPLPAALWHPAVRAWLEANPAAFWAIALSGGADSVALAESVVAEARQRGRDVVALHFNHCLRGAESDGDQQWVESWCAARGVRLVVGRWTDRGSSGSEGEAREARNAFFAKALAAFDSAALFTGHHADDAVETMLMRLARGSGTAGLAAPRPVQTHGPRVVRLRPLLGFRKVQLVASLSATGATWREDSTNAADAPLRNRLRHSVVEAWSRASDRNVHEGVLRARELLEEDDGALQAWADQVAKPLPLTSNALDLRWMAGVPRAVVRRVLRKWAPLDGLSADGFDAFLSLCEAGQGRASVRDGIAEIANGRVRLLVPEPTLSRDPVRLGVGDVVQWLDGDIGYETTEATDELLRRIRSGQVDPDAEAWIAEPPRAVMVRQWAPGDRFSPLGLGGSAKLQDLFVNARVPMEKRQRIPIVSTPTGEILWVPGFPPAESLRVLEGSRVLGRLTYRLGTYTLVKQSP